jgi:ABC-type lipoprotein release transport system permease subunit
MLQGAFTLHKGDVPLACFGAELASNLGLNPHFLTPVEIYFPSRTRRISTSNPAASLEYTKVWPSGIFQAGSDIDKELMVLPIEKMRELLNMTMRSLPLRSGSRKAQEKKSSKEFRQKLKRALGLNSR